MIYIKISESEIQEAKRIIDSSYFFNDFVSYEERVCGVIGENAVREYLGKPRIKLLEFDGGFDILWNGFKTDIKTMKRKSDPRPDWVNNCHLFDLQKKSDAFIFCSFNTRTKILIICGWGTNELIKKVGKYYEKGSIRIRDNGTRFKMKNDIYEIKNSQLLTVYR